MEVIHYSMEHFEKICSQSDVNWVLWGFSDRSKHAKYIEYYSMGRIIGYIDSDKKKWGNKVNGHSVLSPKQGVLLTANIIINERFENDLISAIEKYGRQCCYVIEGDFYRFLPPEEMKDDEKEANLYRCNKHDSEVILFKVYDGLGDTILKIPFLYALNSHKDRHRYWFVVTKPSAFELYKRLFGEQVEYLDKDRFLGDRTYRKNFLKKINRRNCCKAVSFSASVNVHFDIDLLNEKNTNIEDNIWLFKYLEIRKNEEFLAYSDGIALLAEKEFDIELTRNDFLKKLPDELLENYLDVEFGNKYIVLSMTSDSWGNCYSSDKISLAVSHWIENGYQIVILGAGEESDVYNAEVELKVGSESLINLSGQTSIFQSMEIIKNATAFVGIDSAMSHIAFLLHVPSVILMANHKLSRKVYSHNCDYIQYLSVPLECSDCKACKYGSSALRGLCMQEVSPYQIMEAVDVYVRN